MKVVYKENSSRVEYQIDGEVSSAPHICIRCLTSLSFKLGFGEVLAQWNMSKWLNVTHLAIHTPDLHESLN